METRNEKLSRQEAEYLLIERGIRFVSDETKVMADQRIGNDRYEVDALEMTRGDLLAWCDMRYSI